LLSSFPFDLELRIEPFLDYLEIKALKSFKLNKLIKEKKTKQATSSAVLSVFASKSLCVCHFVVIFYICLMVLLLSKKTNPNPKSKK
jgi:uncharacterized membrane protein YwzB